VTPGKKKGYGENVLDFYGNQDEFDEDDIQVYKGNVVKGEDNEDDVDPYNPKDIRNYNRSPFGMSSKVHPERSPSKMNRGDMPDDIDPFSNNALV